MKDNKTDAIEVPVIQVKLEPGAKFFYGTAIWRVLKVNKEEQTVLVIAEECVCERSYHDVLERVTWETCSLRKWLNGEYLETTFTREEQEAIQLTRISTPDNMMYKTNGGNDTEDKVFILSIEEVKEYFSGKELLEVRESWWLRSPGSRNDYGTNCIGYYTTGREVNKVSLVRPALILNL